MKKCFKCKRIKSINAFYIHKGTADGHLNKCKLCTKKDSYDRYNDPEAIKRIVVYERKREQDPRRKAMKLEYQRRRRAESPGKYKARNKVNNAIRDGRLKKGTCELCGSKRTEAHHDDYRRYLDVRWLCRNHHMQVEGKNSYPLIKIRRMASGRDTMLSNEI